MNCLGAIDVRGPRYDRGRAADAGYPLLVNFGKPIDLTGPKGSVRLRVRQIYSFRREGESRRDRWRLIVPFYAYTLLGPELGAREESAVFEGTDGGSFGKEDLIAFHYHPAATGLQSPHIHIYSSICTHAAVMNSHIPSGSVGLEDVVQYLLRDWLVDGQRTDWESVLENRRAQFEAERTSASSGL